MNAMISRTLKAYGITTVAQDAVLTCLGGIFIVFNRLTLTAALET